MTTTRIDRVPLHQLGAGQLSDFFVVLTERERRTTREGKPFYSLKFRDRYRTVSAPVWEDTPLFGPCEAEWRPGQHFKVRAVYEENARYGPQIEIHNIRLATPEDWVDGYSPDSFIQATRFDLDQLWTELQGSIESIENVPLRSLVQTVIGRNESLLRTHPAASHNHHAYRGGLLEHTVSVLRTGLYLADKYRAHYPELDPPLNKDLVIAGCALHDVGKLHELDPGLEVIDYTVAGHLIGHILIGRDMVRQAAQTIEGLDPELLLYLEHIIVSHQGAPEWGSPKMPMFPEALLVHYADDLDAKMNMFVGIIDANPSQGPVSDTKNALRRRVLLRRTV